MSLVCSTLIHFSSDFQKEILNWDVFVNVLRDCETNYELLGAFCLIYFMVIPYIHLNLLITFRDIQQKLKFRIDMIITIIIVNVGLGMLPSEA